MDLVTHYGSDKFGAPELMKEALVAVFFTRFWSQQSQTGNGSVFSEPEMETALFVHKFMRIVQFNCHEVTCKSQDGKIQVKIFERF